MGAKTAEEYLSETMPNVIERLENLESFATKVDKFLFTDEPGKPALATVAYAVHRHVMVWCTYATWLSAATRAVAKTMKRVTYIIAGIVAIIAAVSAIGHFFGISHAFAQALNEKGSFHDYVNSVLRSDELAHFGVLLGFGCLGVGGHYFWRWVTDQIVGSLWKYLFVDYPKRTLASFCCLAGWAVWAIDPTLTWTQTINLALTTGFAIDVLVNKATKGTNGH